MVAPDDGFQALDSTAAKTHRSAAGGKGGRKSRGSAARAAAAPPRSTPFATRKGRPLAFEATPGRLGDVKAAIVLLAQAPAAKALAADCADNARGLRRRLRRARRAAGHPQ